MVDKVEIGRLRVGRKQLVAEDLAMGEGTVKQNRDGASHTFHKIGAETLMYDDTRSLKDAIDEEKAREFAFLRIDPITGNLIANHAEINTFRISDKDDEVGEGHLIHDPSLDPVRNP